MYRMSMIAVFVGLYVLFAASKLAMDMYRNRFTRICSWNIEFFGTKNVNDHTLSYYNDIVRRIEIINPDIVCIQEVASVHALQHVASKLQDYSLFISDNVTDNNARGIETSGFDYVHREMNARADGKAISQLLCNAVLVKKKINVVRFETIHERTIKCTYYDENIKENVSVYNIHLPSDRAQNNSASRYRILQNLLADAIDAKENVVLCGDFNAKKHSPEIQLVMSNQFHESNDIIRSLYYQKYDLTDETTASSTFWRNTNRDNLVDTIELTKIDYFFVSNPLKHHIRGGFVDTSNCIHGIDTILNKSSDHCMLVLDLS